MYGLHACNSTHLFMWQCGSHYMNMVKGFSGSTRTYWHLKVTSVKLQFIGSNNLIHHYLKTCFIYSRNGHSFRKI